MKEYLEKNKEIIFLISISIIALIMLSMVLIPFINGIIINQQVKQFCQEKGYQTGMIKNGDIRYNGSFTEYIMIGNETPVCYNTYTGTTCSQYDKDIGKFCSEQTLYKDEKAFDYSIFSEWRNREKE